MNKARKESVEKLTAQKESATGSCSCKYIYIYKNAISHHVSKEIPCS